MVGWQLFVAEATAAVSVEAKRPTSLILHLGVVKFGQWDRRGWPAATGQ